MKKYIIFALLGGLSGMINAQQISPYSSDTLESKVFEQAAEIDIAKALYGKIAGLNVIPGNGSSVSNLASLQIHGHTPLILVDGSLRNISDLMASEIESVTVLKDASATALYGIRGANGVVMITTKRGREQKLKVTAHYQLGINTQFRRPEFADANTFAQSLNEALLNDGLAPRYNSQELEAFKSATYPDEYPNVNWWKEAFANIGINHRLDFTFNGGGKRFKYFTAVEYYRDLSMLSYNQDQTKYSTKPTDTRLNLRTNLDVDITDNTFVKLGVMGKLQEVNQANCGDIFDAVYRTPATVFPVKHANGIYGGNAIYGNNNPVGMLTDMGHYQQTVGLLLADLNIEQRLDALTEGLSANVSVAFDNCGSMYESTSKEYRYMDAQGCILPDGTLVTRPIMYGKDSETTSHSQGFESLYMRSDFQFKLAYDRSFNDLHHISANLLYSQQSLTRNGRNRGQKQQSLLGTVTYNYKEKYMLNGVISHSGTAYLPDNDKYRNYPAVSAAWVASNEEFMKSFSFIDRLKLQASYGLSGWDGNLSHELWRQAYGGSYAGGYYLGKNVSESWGQGEGPLPVENLTAEKSKKFTLGLDMQGLANRLSLSVDAFYEKRSDILVSSTNSVSSIIGIELRDQNAGIYKYRGLDAAISWNDKAGNWEYGIGATLSYIDSKIVNENQAFQEYDYLYHTGNRVGQCYGLEVIGFFKDQMEINNSPAQTFSQVYPGDIKYKDQNGDNKIDDKDVVRMFGTSSPRCYFGMNLRLAYKNIEVVADFQGMTGVTTSLLNSPLYTPLVSNGNISKTYLDNETPWSADNKENATVPRLTTQFSANNYRNNSLWYRDASYIKLRNLVISYTFPKTMLQFAEMKLFAQGTNLFSLDNIGFSDPEQLFATYPSIRSYWAGIKLNF